MRVQFLLIISIFISFSQAETTLRIRLNRKSFAFMASVLEGVMHLSGDLSFKMDGIKAFIRVNLVSRKRRLQIDLKECRLKIGSADLTLYGGIGAWIANHFVSGIKQDIKKSVQKVVCEDLRIGLSSLNENLWSLENEIDLNANTHLSFELLKDAKVTKNFIQFDFSASASFGESKCYLQSKGIDISDNDSNISNHMAVVWVDESAINCYLKTWYDTVDHPLYIKNIPNTKQFYLNCIEANNCTEGELNNLDMDMDNRNELVELIDADIFLIGEPVLRVDNRIYIETKMETILHRSQKDSNKLDSTKFKVDKNGRISRKVKVKQEIYDSYS
uniref:BPI1 domain-containing protein n=1 Tax=Elaeophora elaphi TaxID=1147741 RepID=A0A0R3S751_9BILA